MVSKAGPDAPRPRPGEHLFHDLDAPRDLRVIRGTPRAYPEEVQGIALQTDAVPDLEVTFQMRKIHGRAVFRVQRPVRFDIPDVNDIAAVGSNPFTYNYSEIRFDARCCCFRGREKCRHAHAGRPVRLFHETRPPARMERRRHTETPGDLLPWLDTMQAPGGQAG